MTIDVIYVIPRESPAKAHLCRELGSMPSLFHIGLGPKCNRRCAYCFNRSHGATWEATEDLHALLGHAGRLSLGTGMLAGGEPSIFPDLPALLAFGRSQGVESYWIATNATGLTDKKLVWELHAQGVRRWQLSWDDPRPPPADADPLSLKYRADHIVAALENLHALPEAVITINQVVTRRNLPAIVEMIDAVGALRSDFPRVTAVAAAFVKPAGWAWERKKELLFALSDAIPLLCEAFTRATALGLSYVVIHVPGCLVAERADRFMPTAMLDRVLSLRDQSMAPSEELASVRHAAACGACRLSEVCPGFHERYADLFGDEPFRPTGQLLR